MISSAKRLEIDNWVKNTFETRKMNPMTLSLDYYTPHYGIIDEPAQPLVIQFSDNYIRLINDNPDEYPRLHVPFITRGISELQVSNRTIERWNDVPIPYKTAYIDKCKTPPLKDLPSSSCKWWIKINPDHRENIVPIFDRKDLHITIRIINSNRSTTITKDRDGDIWASGDVRGATLKDVFELQDWLIENGFEALV
ncbi:hypothetical protein RsoM2USA_321 [Ralstonia phage RsoM2USA]|nr:hypothetical protein RsoM2USA_321 [Ralstonia phage RsoM2USA]